jgi:hypothetical protein
MVTARNITLKAKHLAWLFLLVRREGREPAAQFEAKPT